MILSPDPEDLTRNSEIYYGKHLAIKGEIEDIKSYGVFELDEEQVFGGEDLLGRKYLDQDPQKSDSHLPQNQQKWYLDHEQQSLDSQLICFHNFCFSKITIFAIRFNLPMIY